MKILLAIALIASLLSGAAVAEEKNFGPRDRFCVLEKKPAATEPVGAIMETTGVFVGTITSAAEIALTGERKVTVENETGETRIFPFSSATKITDKTFHAATFDQLKKDRKVEVEYAEEGAVPTAKKVTITDEADKGGQAPAAK
jgi:hypothetical protein